MKVPQIQDADGNDIPSMTGSYLAWRAYCAQRKRPMKATFEGGICSLCGGWRDIVTEQFGKMWCLCKIEERTRLLQIQHSEFHSISNENATLENFKIWGSTNSQNSLVKFLDYIGDWYMWPEKWLTIQGDPGSGKSHILSALDKKFQPWSLYMTSADFESKAFKATKVNKKNEEDKDKYDIEDMIDVISQAPILLFDDYGQEYGKDYIKALFRRVIDFRYRRPTEYVTVMTTNLNSDDLYQKDERVADRVLDSNIGKLLILQNVQSWRCKDGNHQFTDLD